MGLKFTRNDIAAYVYGKMSTDHPTVVLYFENTAEIDLDSQSDVFALCLIDFIDIDRLNVDADVMREYLGEIIIRVFTREGSGVAPSLDLADYLLGVLSDVDIPTGITCKTSYLGKKVVDSGWMMVDVVTPFVFWNV